MFSEEDCVMNKKNVYVGGYSKSRAVKLLGVYAISIDRKLDN